MRSLSLLLAGSALAVAIAACQQTVTRYEPVEDAENATPKKKSTSQGDGGTDPKDNTCLGKANLAFDDEPCNTCMSDNAGCCAATIACFTDNPDCSSLHSCISKCGGAASAPADGGATTGNANALALFTNTVYPTLDTTCAGCHRTGSGGAPIFFGADAATTYTQFKTEGFHRPNSGLVTKGAHRGPALTTAQRSAIDAWVAAEGAGTGGGMGNGTGGGNGMGTGTGAGATACKDACKAQHPDAVTKWQAYNTCSAVTCKAECL